MTCPACEEDFENEFSLGALPIKPLSDTPLQEFTNAFEYTLPVSKAKVVFKLLTSKDAQDITEALEVKRKLKSKIDNLVTLKLQQCILSINGETDKSKLAYSIQNMRAQDSRALRDRMHEIEPTVDTKQTVLCPHCAVESEVKVPIGASFFWPDFGP